VLLLLWSVGGLLAVLLLLLDSCWLTVLLQLQLLLEAMLALGLLLLLLLDSVACWQSVGAPYSLLLVHIVVLVGIVALAGVTHGSGMRVLLRHLLLLVVLTVVTSSSGMMKVLRSLVCRLLGCIVGLLWRAVVLVPLDSEPLFVERGDEVGELAIVIVCILDQLDCLEGFLVEKSNVLRMLSVKISE